MLGKLFERSGNSPSTAAPLALNESRTHAIMASRGRQLVDRYWGRYVAFLHDDAANTSWVLRDPPAATVPHGRFGGVRIYFSAMDESSNWGWVRSR